MNIRQLLESMDKILNEETKDINIVVLADWAGVDENAITKIEIDPIFELPKYEISKENEKEIYTISANETKLLNAVAASLRNLFESMTVLEFTEKILPYMGDWEDYLPKKYVDQLEPFDYELGYNVPFIDNIKFKKMAEDNVVEFNYGHELATYDQKTNTYEYNGKTYYIFRQEH